MWTKKSLTNVNQKQTLTDIDQNNLGDLNQKKFLADIDWKKLINVG